MLDAKCFDPYPHSAPNDSRVTRPFTVKPFTTQSSTHVTALADNELTMSAHGPNDRYAIVTPTAALTIPAAIEIFVKTSNLKAVKGKNLTVKVDQDKPLTKPIVEERTPQPAVKQPEITQPEVVKAPEVREPQPEISKSPADEVIEQLKAVNSFHKLESVIKPLKDEGKITDYGKYITMKEPAACYLIVYDQQGNIKALLGPGITSRRNLKTNLDDSEKNYHGCGAIWLKIKE